LKYVFVTGASGFVGRHFCKYLESSPDWTPIAAAEGFDLRDAADVTRTIASLRPLDAVLHLAAQSNVPEAFADPYGTLQINFLGTLALLNALCTRDSRKALEEQVVRRFNHTQIADWSNAHAQLPAKPILDWNNADFADALKPYEARFANLDPGAWLRVRDFILERAGSIQ